MSSERATKFKSRMLSILLLLAILCKLYYVLRQYYRDYQPKYCRKFYQIGFSGGHYRLCLLALQIWAEALIYGISPGIEMFLRRFCPSARTPGPWRLTRCARASFFFPFGTTSQSACQQPVDKKKQRHKSTLAQYNFYFE